MIRIICILFVSLFIVYSCSDNKSGKSLTVKKEFNSNLDSTHIESDWKKYSGSEFSITYPSSWTMSIVNGLTAFVSPADNPNDNFRENVNVSVQYHFPRRNDIKQHEYSF